MDIEQCGEGSPATMLHLLQWHHMIIEVAAGGDPLPTLPWNSVMHGDRLGRIGRIVLGPVLCISRAQCYACQK